MQVAAGVLGIIGGLAGIVGSFFALTVGGLGATFGAEGAEAVVGLGWVALVFALGGTVGGGLVFARPRPAAWLMLASAVGGTVCISMGYVVVAPLLLVASILAFLVKKVPGQTAE